MIAFGALIVATPIHRRPVQLCFPVVQCCWRYIVMITRRCFALAAASALASGITAKRANALAWPTILFVSSCRSRLEGRPT